MDQIASVEKLKKCLDAIKISDTYTDLQNLITELHFAYESYRFKRDVPGLSDQRTLWDTAYYLLTALTNPRRRSRMPSSDVQDGLAISGLVFELLGRYAEARADLALQRDCFLNAAIVNTLSRYEANSAVLARSYFKDDLLPENKQDFLSRPAEYGMNMTLALLAREFFWIHHHEPIFSKLLDPPEKVNRELDDIDRQYGEETGFWVLVCRAVIQFVGFMISGEERAYRAALTTLSNGRQIARDYELLSEHWLASRLLDCLERMEERSTWRVLRAHGFSEDYISTLTRFPWNAVHELWQSQIDALTRVETPDQPERSSILSDDVNRVVVSMPTSAGKTLLAEMVIVQTLQHKPGSKCVYVAPTRALVDEIETKLHRRLRFLGYRVTSVVGAFEISTIEQDYLETVDVAVLTPEKLDYLFRKRDPFADQVELIIFDEIHKVGEGNRGWFLETLVTWLLLKPNLKDAKMVFMTAVLPRSQQPLVRLWLGQESIAPIVVSNWSPTRQLIGVLWYPQLTPDWDHPVDLDSQGNRCYWGTCADLTFRYDIGTEHRTLEGLYRLRFWVNDDFKRVRRDEETRYDRCLKLIALLGSENSTLVYFQEKKDLVRFCKHAQKELDRLKDPNLDRLVQYVSARLGPDFPIVRSLPYGVAFHHGDLPVDVRNEIESAYRDKVIRVLACTTTLAEGVNLPIQTFILGYHQTWSKHRLSVSDFKNIIGRAGRALIETEGKIIAIRHPEFARDDDDAKYFESLVSLDESELVIKSEFPPRRLQDERERVVDELSALTQTIKDAQALAQVEYVEELADVLQRLQVFIFTIYEDRIIDHTPELVDNALKSTFLFIQNPDPEIRQAVSRLSQRFATICSQMDSTKLRRFNTSGLRYKSNILLEQLAERIAKRCAGLKAKQYTFKKVISREDIQFILDNIREARPQRSEYRKNQYRVVEGLDHYSVLIDWLNGGSFSSIRDTYFGELDSIAVRTETCQSYISKQFTFKLPWALAALHTHAERLGNPTLILWLEAAPAQVKYGVDTPEAVYFSSVGVQSRFLARALGELYREERGAMSASDWQPLGDWFLGLSPFYLRDKISHLPELAIRQAIRRANVIRRPSRTLRRTGRVIFNIAGWQYYSGEKLIDELFERSWGEEKPLAQLQHELDNEYDEYAVAIHWGQPTPDSKLGYVPRRYNEEIAILLALGRRLEARVIAVGSSLQPSGWRRVEVRVELITDRRIEW